MAGTDGHKCKWRWHDGVRDDIVGLGAQGSGLLVAAVKQFAKGEALPRQVKPLGGGLLELRVNQGNNHYRLIFFQPKPYIAVALHAFYKNTQKTRKSDLDLAKLRKKLWESRAEG